MFQVFRKELMWGGRRLVLDELADQVNLALRPQRRLEDDDVSRRPRPRLGSGRAEALHGHSQPRGGRPDAHPEKQIILDQVEPFAHTFAGYPARPFWLSPNVAIIAPGEMGRRLSGPLRRSL